MLCQKQCIILLHLYFPHFFKSITDIDFMGTIKLQKFGANAKQRVYEFRWVQNSVVFIQMTGTEHYL